MEKGVIFDFDGTIVDSEIPRLMSLNEVLKLEGINYIISDEAWNLNYRRLRSVDILEDIKKRNNFDYDSYKLYEKSHIIREELEKKGVRVIRGFFRFYEFLKKHNIKMIIASGGRREHIQLIMAIDNLPKIEIIAREDYKNVKPEPDCYNLAIKKLGLSSKDVIIFDDSVTGLEAGIRAGARVIAINSSDIGVNELDILMNIKNYEELDLNKFLKIL